MKCQAAGPYRALWLAGFIYWLAAIQWLRLAHPAVYIGWFVLSAYLAVYLPVFVAITRIAVHRLRVPLWLAAPVVWTGLELARRISSPAFSWRSLAHTQARNYELIQISDLVGEYGVDFLNRGRGSGNNIRCHAATRPLALHPAQFLCGSAIAYGHGCYVSTNLQCQWKYARYRPHRTHPRQQRSPTGDSMRTSSARSWTNMSACRMTPLTKAKQTGDGRRDRSYGLARDDISHRATGV